jgi:hypothetical protein
VLTAAPMKTRKYLLTNAKHGALLKSHVIACELVQTIAHPNINWRNNNGLSTQDQSAENALSHFRFQKVLLQEMSESFLEILCEEQEFRKSVS